MRHVLSFSLGLLGLAGLTACPNKNVPAPTTQASVAQVTFVKGNPHALIAGATFNSTSPLTTATAAGWNGSYSLLGISQFVEQTSKPNTGAASNVEKDAATQDVPRTANQQLAIAQVSPSLWRMQLHNQGTLDFKVLADGELQPTSATLKDGVHSLNPLHWSVSADESTISLLTESADSTATGRDLIVFYFEKLVANQPERHADPSLIYSFGHGRAIGWSVPSLNIDLCGAHDLDDTVKAAVGLWQNVLVNRLRLNYTYHAAYPPFSDLNTHCVYVVDAYLVDSRPDVFTYGQTHEVISEQRQAYIDADTFIWNAEWSKLTDYLLNNDFTLDDAQDHRDELMPRIVLHEIGHILGLGHQMDKPSVMGYKYQWDQPTDYDILAIQTLYPLLTTTP